MEIKYLINVTHSTKKWYMQKETDIKQILVNLSQWEICGDELLTKIFSLFNETWD